MRRSQSQSKQIINTLMKRKSLPEIWLGIVDWQGNLKVVRQTEAVDTHYLAGLLNKGSRWRWRTDSNTVLWWEPPTDHEKEAVAEWAKARYDIDIVGHADVKTFDAHLTKLERDRIIGAFGYNKSDDLPIRYKLHPGETSEAYTDKVIRPGRPYDVWLGSCDHEKGTSAVKQTSGCLTHSEAHLTGQTWRWRTDGNIIFWWHTPTQEEMEDAADWLKDHFKVAHVGHASMDKLEMTTTPRELHHILRAFDFDASGELPDKYKLTRSEAIIDKLVL